MRAFAQPANRLPTLKITMSPTTTPTVHLDADTHSDLGGSQIDHRPQGASQAHKYGQPDCDAHEAELMAAHLRDELLVGNCTGSR